ncbi:LysE/ArgO family amino acid transporter [Aliamphritea ceti]|uniref:LysE/ArgO family amino acid transporter n=1 Tax=Aliamphritea ceti TaxID=1524258 RepID=UPI0021C335E4|nr:LysE/ArgO family amino acid transporter [Aliamphritea ceti]
MLALPFFKGMGLGASLIIAIGSQNAFVLSSALRRQHALTVAWICIVIDAALIISGVFGLGALIRQAPVLLDVATWGGALFLLVYGSMAFHRAWRPEGLKAAGVKTLSLKGAVLTTAALSLLNPHVYLDTVVLLGSIGGQLPGKQPLWFALGACLASLLWFLTLVIGGRMLAPWFRSAASWQKLDILVGITMWLIAAMLIHKGLS